MMKFIATLVALTASTALAACPNRCSGHGSCGSADLCSCQTRWTGPDCSLRECPFGLSWTVEGTGITPGSGGMGGMHPYTECSSKGICDTSTGECQCFDGYEGRGCRRQACPNDCSGNGRCIRASAVNSNYAGTSGAAFASQTWDQVGARVCACDRGYEGYDCSSRVCPKGDDPVTDCSTGGAADANSLAHNMVQRLYVATADTPGDADDCAAASFGITGVTGKRVDGSGGLCDPGVAVTAGQTVLTGTGTAAHGALNYLGYISLKYTDMFGGEYFTRPILIDVSEHATQTATEIDRAVQWAGTNSEMYTAETTAPTVTTDGPNFIGGTASADHAGVGGTGSSNGDMMKRSKLKRYTADRIRDALQDLPNFAIPQVNVTNYISGSDIWGNVFDITFGDHATAGKQQLLECVYDVGRACDGAQPKMANQDPYGASTIAGGHEARANRARTTVNGALPAVQGESTFVHSCAVYEVPLVTGRDYEENSECANRGLCDSSTGICSCFEGHTGENCSTQTVFF